MKEKKEMDVELKILSVEMLRGEKYKTVKAKVSFEISPVVTITDARIIDSKDGRRPRLCMPSYRTDDGIWHPFVEIDGRLRRQVDGLLLAEYERRKAELEGG